MGVTVLLAGQDITSFFNEPSIHWDSALGQGAGVPGQLSGRATTAEFLTSLGPAENALGSGQALPVYYKNLLAATDSDMEVSVANWQTFASGVTISQDATHVQQGSQALKVVLDGTVTFQDVHLTTTPTLLPGQTYTASFYLYGDGTHHLRAVLNQASGGDLGSTDLGVVPAAWTRYSITFTTPNTPPPAWAYLRLDDNGVAAAITFWVDAVQLEMSSAAHAWVDGGTTVGTPALVRQGELKVFDGTNAKVFGGYVTLMDDDTDKKQNYTDVQAHDYWQDLDRFLVNKVYVNQSDTFIINDLITNYAPGISLSLVNLSAVNFTFQKVRFVNRTLLQALQKIADTTGFDIWVDVNKNLRYTNPTNLGTAAFAISDNPNFTTSFPAKITKWEQDDNAIINRVTFFGGKHPTGDFTQDISTQANSNNTTFTLAYYPRESSNGTIQVKINGVSQVVGYANSSGPNNTLKSAGGNADVLVNPDAQTLTFNVAPTTGQTVLAIYRYDTPLVVQLTNQPSFSFFGRWFDGVIADPSVTDTTTAIARCRIMLVEQAYGLLTIGLTCYQPGLVAGTQLRVDNGPRNIHQTYIIQEVHAKAQGGGTFHYEVVLGAWNWQLADVLLAASRYYTPSDNATNETSTPLQVQGLAQNVAVHDKVLAINHFASSWYYARAVPVGDTHDAYPGFFTVNSVLPTAACNNASPGLGGGLSGTANVIATGHVQ